MHPNSRWLVAVAALMLGSSSCRSVEYAKFRPAPAEWVHVPVVAAPVPVTGSTPSAPRPVRSPVPAASLDSASAPVPEVEAGKDVPGTVPDTAASRPTVAPIQGRMPSPLPASSARRHRALRVAGAAAGGAAAAALVVVSAAAVPATLVLGAALGIVFLVGGAGVLVVRKLIKRRPPKR